MFCSSIIIKIQFFKNTMLPFLQQTIWHQTFLQMAPTQPIFFPIYLQDQLNPLYFQNIHFESNILQSQQRNEIDLLLRENETISRQNEQLRATETDQTQRVKRKYRKRRLWLEKKFRCNHKNCKKRYSSKIALNSHKRKKHPKGPQQSSQ